MSGFWTRLGLARSLVIYHGQFWKKRALTRFYRSLCQNGDLCFDIGAHVGNRSGALLAAGASVVALEPQPAFHDFLRRFFRSERFTLLNQAVASKPGTMTLRISSRHPTVTTLSSDWIGKVRDTDGFAGVDWDREAQVDVTTLDALIARFGRPRFCKIDVEGMEADILNGLSEPLDLIAFEYLPASLEIADACVARLDQLGRYRYNWTEAEDHRFKSSVWLDGPSLLKVVAASARDAGRSGDIYARLERG